MNSNKVYEARKSIKDIIAQKEITKRKEGQTKDFHFMSANLSRFMPEIPIEDHWDIYLDIITTMRLREFDLTEIQQFSNKIGMNFNDSGISPEPKIYITCHLGFCKAAMSVLILNGISKIALIVDENTYNKQAKSILEINDHFCGMFHVTNYLKVINVEKANTVIEISQLIKQGYSLYAFLDGNSGYKGVYNKEKTIEVKFLSDTIHSRTGLAKIAYFTKTPIVPFITYYSEDKLHPHVHFFEEIKIDHKVDINDFADKAIRNIYSHFEIFIRKYPNQWEAWFYLHKYLSNEVLLSKDKTIDILKIEKKDIVDNKFAVFKIDENSYMLDRLNYIVYPIDDQQFTLLKTE
ncbi:hypothetical protein DBR28_17600 [Chryseobacterium sp. HMWF028]|nr:hypothetical protein DBR28_17600 [Chryseobacterium sp. HMWF028]